MNVQQILVILSPVFFVIFLGYMAGRFKKISVENAKGLTTFVTKFALPAFLFVGIMSTSRSKVIENMPFFLTIVSGLLGFYLIVMIVSKFVFKIPLTRASIYGLNSTQPSFAFVGIPVLGGIFGTDAATIPIAITGVVVNAMLIPLASIFATIGQNQDKDKSLVKVFFSSLLKGLSSPLAWVPLLALVLTMLNSPTYPLFHKMLDMVGETTSGVALFAIGATVGIRKINLSCKAIGLTGLKMVALPVFAFLMTHLFNLSSEDVVKAVLIVCFPCSSVAAMVASEFKELESETSSAFVLSTISSLITVPIIISLLM